jgi:hypothetical protein
MNPGQNLRPALIQGHLGEFMSHLRCLFFGSAQFVEDLLFPIQADNPTVDPEVS